MHFSFMFKVFVGAVVAGWVTWGSTWLGSTLVKPQEADVRGFQVAVAATIATAAPEVEEAPVDVIALIAEIDIAKGERVFKKCSACHNAAAGAKNKVGPNLWNIVNQDKAAVAGFSYSGALTGLDGAWTYENLNEFLTSPKDYAPGNKMTYRGLKKPEDRAAVIAWLRAQADAPAPLPGQ